MKSLYLFVLSLFCLSTIQAQVLVKERVYPSDEYQAGGDWYDMETCQIVHQVFGCAGCGSGGNYRSHLSNSYWNTRKLKDDYKLPLSADLAGQDIIDCDSIASGYYCVAEKTEDYQLETKKYTLVVFDVQKRETARYDLNDLTGNFFGSIDQLLCVDGQLYFNYVGRNSAVGSDAFGLYRIFCFDLNIGHLVWKSDYQTNRSEFTLLDNYLLTGYGYVNGSGRKVEDGQLYLLDLKTGMTISELPIYATPYLIDYTLYNVADNRPVEWMTEEEQKGIRAENKIIVCEQAKSTVYRFSVQKEAVTVTGDYVRLRRGPSTSDEVYTDANGKTVYPANGDNLLFIEELAEWFKVRFNDESLYISKKFSKKTDGANLNIAVMEKWKEQFPTYTCDHFFISSLDEDEIGEYVIVDNNYGYSIYTVANAQGQPDPNAIQFVCRHESEGLTYFPSESMIRFYNGVATGDISEYIYKLHNSRLEASYAHLEEPQGNIREQDEVAIKTTYTKTLPGKKPQPITEKQFEQIKSPLESLEGLSFDFDI